MVLPRIFTLISCSSLVASSYKLELKLRAETIWTCIFSYKWKVHKCNRLQIWLIQQMRDVIKHEDSSHFSYLHSCCWHICGLQARWSQQFENSYPYMTMFKRTTFPVRLSYKEFPFMSYWPDWVKRLFAKLINGRKVCASVPHNGGSHSNNVWIFFTFMQHTAPFLSHSH